MVELIDKKYILVNEPQKLGLPRVMGHAEVNCRGGWLEKTNIPALKDLIWKVVSEELQPGDIIISSYCYV